MADGTEAEVDPGLEGLLEFLRTSRGFDFSGYKRGSLSRRITKRMHTLGVDDFRTYQQRLEAEPQEFADLFNTILINVTAFQRDGEAWEFLSRDVIPRILEARAPEGPVQAQNRSLPARHVRPAPRHRLCLTCADAGTRSMCHHSFAVRPA